MSWIWMFLGFTYLALTIHSLRRQKKLNKELEEYLRAVLHVVYGPTPIEDSELRRVRIAIKLLRDHNREREEFLLLKKKVNWIREGF